MHRGHRQAAVVAAIVGIFVMIFIAFTQRWREPIIRVAVLVGEPERSIQEALTEWKGAQHVQVFGLDYEALHEVVTNPAVLPTYDAVMLDDVWLAELVEHDQIARVPAGQFSSAMKRFVPEFLRTCYYRKGIVKPRRPTLAQTEAEAVDESFGLYGLPFLGNAQTLIAAANTADSLKSWSGIAKALKSSKAPFYSRLGSDNGGLADFLPILWSQGGCLIGEIGGQDVPGLLSKGPAYNAFALSRDLAEFSSVQHTRFKEEDVDRQLAGSDSPIGVSWLSYRIRRKKEQRPLGRYLMPDGDAGIVSSPCAENEEVLAPGKTRRTGELGLWSLAVPRATENASLGWTFIGEMLEQVERRENWNQQDAHCQESRELAERTEMTSPFEDQLSCSVRTLIRHSRPRSAHPDWREIEAAVGFRLRQAHWKTKSVEDAVALASDALEVILKRRQRLNEERSSVRSDAIVSSTTSP